MRSKNSIYPRLIFVDEASIKDEITQRVLGALPDAEVRYVSDVKDPILTYSDAASEHEKFTDGKRVLFLTRHKGSWLKSCPGTSSHVCCNLFIVNPGEGCPLDCTYCYLQSYLKKNPTLKLYTNTSDLFKELEELFIASPNRLFRVGTGELIDSLVWDDLTASSIDFISFFSKFKNAVLEFKTKDNGVSNILKAKDINAGNIVVSWSVNAKTVTTLDEKNTASLDERLEAARDVAEAGYRVGFHFDPVVHFNGWESEYTETINKVFKSVPKEKLAWVSISTLRYKPELQTMMKHRFPESKLPFGEQLLSEDSKLRYIQPIRFKLTRFIWDKIKEKDADVPVYMCMETSAAWREIAGGAPAAGSELREIFSRNVKLPVLMG